MQTFFSRNGIEYKFFTSIHKAQAITLIAQRYSENNKLSRLLGSCESQELSFISLFLDRCVNNQQSIVALDADDNVIGVLLADDAFPKEKELPQRMAQAWQERKHRVNFGGERFQILEDSKTQVAQEAERISNKR